MAFFRNFGVNRRIHLCGVQEYASAQFLDFLELAENCTFLDRKLTSALNETVDGHEITHERKKNNITDYGNDLCQLRGKHRTRR